MRTASFLSDLWVVLRAMTVLSEGSLEGGLGDVGRRRGAWRLKSKSRESQVSWDLVFILACKFLVPPFFAYEMGSQ